MIVSVTLLLMVPAPVDEESWEQLKDRIEAAPQEVATFIERRTGCNHFDGEVGSDNPGREEQVQAARRDLRCDDLEADTRDLQEKYKGSSHVLELLAETEHLMPWSRLPSNH